MNSVSHERISPAELMKDRYGFSDFVKLIRLLRSPEGCPWDREQTHTSIRKNFIEETYEALEAIDNDDLPLLREELGDVMLQVGLHVEMERELGRMDFDDVFTALCKKLVQRHPHVFGEAAGGTPAQALDNWEAIKMRTKGQTRYGDSLKSVPAAFPALMRAQKLQSRAARAGFVYPDVDAAWDKLREETAELREAIDGADAAAKERELGDLLFALVSVAQQMGLDAEEALTRAGQRFTERFCRMEQLAEQREGKPLHELDAADQLNLWQEVKQG